jgi:hypothetical protein
MCLVDALGDSSVILKVLAWIDQRESDFQKARSEAQQAVKDAFDEAGIVMPEPIYNVNLRRLKPGAKRFIAQDPATTPSPAHEEPGKGRENGVGDTSPDTSVDQQIMAERQASSEEWASSHRRRRGYWERWASRSARSGKRWCPTRRAAS